MFNAVNCVEQPRKPACLQHPLCIGFAGVGVNDATARQIAYSRSKFGVSGQAREINIMHIVQVWGRVDGMFAHQPGKCGAVAVPIMLAQSVCFGAPNVERLHDPCRHAHFDLIEKAVLRRVKGIVQVEDPSRDVAELLLDHPDQIAALTDGCNRWVDPVAGIVSVCIGDGGTKTVQKDAYTLILEAIEAGIYKPGGRLVESELAERLGVSRTPVREALQRLETQGMLTRDGRSLIVASLDHNQLAELYTVRSELEGLAARLAARHATDEEIRVLRGMVNDDRALLGGDPRLLSRANKRFHKLIHLASHNRFLVQQLDLVHRSMVLMATTSFAANGRDEVALSEHDQIVTAIEAHDGDAAYSALKTHISTAYETRLRVDAGELKTR